MDPVFQFDLSVILGLSFVWMGVMILLVNGLPRNLRGGEVPTAPKGTPEAFGLWWLDQYAYIGLVVLVLGLLMLGAAALGLTGAR